MSTKIVSYTLDTLPPMTKERMARLEALAARPDSEIDFSDIPELTEEQWKNAERGRIYRPVKRQITARVDADVLEWLKSQGKGYQPRINAILRREMLMAHRSTASKSVPAHSRMFNQAVAALATSCNPRASISNSRILYFWILPESVAGNASTKRTCSGIL